MINIILTKAKPKKIKKKKQDKTPDFNSRQDTCTQEQYWMGRYFYGYAN